MPSITPAQVRHMAKLARLTLTEAEVQRSAQELAAIINFVDLLREVDTRSVEPTAQVTVQQGHPERCRGMTGFSKTLREDVLGCSPTSPDALLACSPLPVVRHQIQTPGAHG